MKTREEVDECINSFINTKYTKRYLMLVTNNNSVNREIHSTPIKLRKDTAILTFALYTSQHVQLFENLNLEGITGILLDNENKNGFNIFELFSKSNYNRNTLIEISPSSLVKIACERYIDYFNLEKSVNRVLIFGTGNLAKRIALSLLERNIYFEFASRKTAENIRIEMQNFDRKFQTKDWGIRVHQGKEEIYDIIFSCFPGILVDELMKPKEFILKAKNIDVGGGGYSKQTILSLRKLKNPVLHVSIDTALFDWLENIESTQITMTGLTSRTQTCGHTHVVIGQALLPDEIAVDRLPIPSRIYGQLTASGMFRAFKCECTDQFSL